MDTCNHVLLFCRQVFRQFIYLYSKQNHSRLNLTRLAMIRRSLSALASLLLASAESRKCTMQCVTLSSYEQHSEPPQQYWLQCSISATQDALYQVDGAAWTECNLNNSQNWEYIILILDLIFELLYALLTMRHKPSYCQSHTKTCIPLLSRKVIQYPYPIQS